MLTVRKAGLYVRVSTDRQTADNQLAEVTQLAVARGYESVVYEEVESAAKVRPVLDRMLADVRAGRVQAVAVWALDRLHRSMTGAINTVLELDRLGVPVLSVRERPGARPVTSDASHRVAVGRAGSGAASATTLRPLTRQPMHPTR